MSTSVNSCLEPSNGSPLWGALGSPGNHRPITSLSLGFHISCHLASCSLIFSPHSRELVLWTCIYSKCRKMKDRLKKTHFQKNRRKPRHMGLIYIQRMLCWKKSLFLFFKFEFKIFTYLYHVTSLCHILVTIKIVWLDFCIWFSYSGPAFFTY